MRSFELVYELKQQTPIIHFQYDQIGAALRATEVKPKLDRYIIERCGDINKVQLEKSEWLIEGTNALNYRMVIKAPDETPEVSKTGEFDIEIHGTPRWERRDRRKELRRDKAYLPLINRMYFGNMVEDARHKVYAANVRSGYKETVFYANGIIKLTIVCMVPELRSFIDECVEGFFLTTNFGTRQTKGFGGFLLVSKRHAGDWRPDPQKYFRHSELQFFYTVLPGGIENGNHEKHMDIAACIYAVMKGGVNCTTIPRRGSDAYVKGYIQRQYLDDIGLASTGSEKAFIKSSVLSDDTPKYTEHLFVRALLGLTDNYKYDDADFQETVRIYSLGQDSFDVERMHSPVTIKIFNNYIFFIFGSIDSILDKEFFLLKDSESNHELSNMHNYDEKAAYIRTHGSIIRTPKPGFVNWSTFISGFIRYFGSDDVVIGMNACMPPYSEAARLTLRTKI